MQIASKRNYFRSFKLALLLKKMRKGKHHMIVLDTNNQSLTKPQAKKKKSLTLIENTCRNNQEFYYTQNIKELGKKFDYSSNSEYFWSKPEFSLLYSTPLYEAASDSQKLALNHLYWMIFYYGTASSETGAIFYNQITAGVFEAVGGYETLCQELALETSQEREHIRAFQKVCRETSKALLGTKVLTQFLQEKSNHSLSSKTSTSPRKRDLFAINSNNSPLRTYEDRALRYIVKTMLKNQEEFYSKYLIELEQQGKFFSAPKIAWNRRNAPAPINQLSTLSCASSPFLACFCYFSRYLANALTKTQEHRHSLYFKELQNQGEFIPVPTAISRYHFLDESFHMTTSQTLARDLYKEFPKPTAYEKLIANGNVYLLQRMVNSINGISSGLHGNYFGDDSLFMSFVYKLLQTPIFDMSSQDALYWIEQSLCHEHQGFHQTFKYHQKLASSLRQLASELDYLWPVNREMRLLDSRVSIDKAIQSNIKTFEQFSKSVTASL